MKQPSLSIRNLHVIADGRQILNGVTLTVKSGETHALMGPNGSGKSTLAMTLMGHASYRVTKGTVTFRGKNILKLAPEERAKLGLFVSFQHPVEVPGVPMRSFLRTAAQAVHGPADGFNEQLARTVTKLGFGSDLIDRNLNEGFSGGEKKRSEIVQMAMLKPRQILLDEPDSGLDPDALKRVCRGIDRLRTGTTGLLLITHGPRIIRLLKPDYVHVLVGGRIVRSGNRQLASAIANGGFGRYTSSGDTQ